MSDDRPVDEVVAALAKDDDEDAAILKQILKFEPKKGDVIVLQLDRNYPMERMWEQLDEFREKAGIQILAVTDDIDVFPINEAGSYALVVERSLPSEHKERIEKDWAEKFPASKLVVVDGSAAKLVESGDYAPDPVDGLDTL